MHQATALSVGMSPGGGLSMQRKGQRSEAHMFENNLLNNGMGNIALNNYESLGGNTRGFNRINANRFT